MRPHGLEQVESEPAGRMKEVGVYFATTRRPRRVYEVTADGVRSCLAPALRRQAAVMEVICGRPRVETLSGQPE